MSTGINITDLSNNEQETGYSLAVSEAENQNELQEMKQLRTELRILNQYIKNLRFVTYESQLEDMKDDRRIKQNRVQDIRRLRHKRAQQKYDSGNGKEKNRARAKKYWREKKAKQKSVE